MESNEGAVLAFLAEWFDPHSQLLKQYLLTYHVNTSEVEMNDLKTRRKFLKRTKLPRTLNESNFMKDSNIVLFSRELKLVDYADTAMVYAHESKNAHMILFKSSGLNELISHLSSHSSF